MDSPFHGSNSLADFLSRDTTTDSSLKERGRLETKGPQNNGGVPWTVSAGASRSEFRLTAPSGRTRFFSLIFGFPCQEAATSRECREILDGIGKAKEPRRPLRREQRYRDRSRPGEERGTDGGALFLTTPQSMRPASLFANSSNEGR